jgi:hypothetical protein
MAVDEGRIGQVRARASQAVEDLSSEGMVGLAAIRACARVHDLLETLQGKNAKPTLDGLRAATRELEGILRALEAGQFEGALEAALGRTTTVARAATQQLAAALGEAP